MLHYIEGEKIILVDNLSMTYCIPTLGVTESSNRLVDSTGIDELDEFDGYFLNEYYSGVSDEDLTDIFVWIIPQRPREDNFDTKKFRSYF